MARTRLQKIADRLKEAFNRKRKTEGGLTFIDHLRAPLVRIGGPRRGTIQFKLDAPMWDPKTYPIPNPFFGKRSSHVHCKRTNWTFLTPGTGRQKRAKRAHEAARIEASYAV